MGLSAAQLTALKTDITANAATIPAGKPWSGGFVGMAVKDVPNNGDGNAAVAGWYNLAAAPDFNVFRSNVPADDITNQITWANYTPSVALLADGTNAVLLTASSMLNQGRVFNLSMLLPPGGLFNAGLSLKRNGLNDATANVLQKGDGTTVSGGWTGILAILRRLATNTEKLFAVATTGVGTGAGALGATGNPGLMAFEGSITGDDVLSARNS